MANNQAMYHITFQKDFGGVEELINGEMEWLIYTTPDKGWCIDKARQLNHNPMINLNIERFRVWFSEKGKHNKKTSKCIYPSATEPLLLEYIQHNR